LGDSQGEPDVKPIEPRTALDLLDRDYAFGQRRLLTPDRFIEEAKTRGVNITIGHLEAAHEVGLLIPLYRVDLDKRQVRRALRADGYFGFPQFSLEILRELRDDGQLTALGPASYRPWLADRVQVGKHRQTTSVYLYSPWQLLKLHELQMELPGFRPVGRAAYGRRRYRAPEPTAFSVLHLHQWVFVVLSALEALYYPDIILKTSAGFAPTPDDWMRLFGEWQGSQDAADNARWIRLSADQVTDLADALTTRTSFFDPLRAWTDLIRLMGSDKWEELRGDARLAVDHRIASEMLYRLRDDLANEGYADPLPEVPRWAWTPRSERWNRPAHSIDQVLTDYGLSPEPSLVWALEGQVEIAFASRVMDFLKVPRHRSFIRLHDVGGNDKDYGLLAQYIGVPATGAVLGDDFVLLDRPVTRFFISTDPENRLRTAIQRVQLKNSIVQSMLNRLDGRFRTAEVRGQLDGMVSIETWTADASFEFAHFTDGELTSAIEGAYTARGTRKVHVDQSALAALRRRNGNLKSLLRTLPPPNLKKDELVDYLWPILILKLETTSASSRENIPIVRHLQKAIELATLSFRRHIGMSF
jgi:hypothetical protein